MPRQKAIGVPISISSGEDAEEDGEIHGSGLAQQRLLRRSGRGRPATPASAQRQPLEGEEDHQERRRRRSACRRSRRAGRAPGSSRSRSGSSAGRRRPPCRRRRRGSRGRRSRASRGRRRGRKWISTSKPMWKFSRTPTAAPRKMNQLMTRIEAARSSSGSRSARSGRRPARRPWRSSGSCPAAATQSARRARAAK